MNKPVIYSNKVIHISEQKKYVSAIHIKEDAKMTRIFSTVTKVGEFFNTQKKTK